MEVWHRNVDSNHHVANKILTPAPVPALWRLSLLVPLACAMCTAAAGDIMVVQNKVESGDLVGNLTG
jgi:hypothetical protein